MNLKAKVIASASMLGALVVSADTATELGIVPRPKEIRRTEGDAFKVSKDTLITFDKASERPAAYLAQRLSVLF